MSEIQRIHRARAAGLLLLAFLVPGPHPAHAQGMRVEAGGIVSGGGAWSGHPLGVVPTWIAGSVFGDHQVHTGLEALAVAATSIGLGVPLWVPYAADTFVTVDVRAPFGTPSATLYYRAGGEVNWAVQPMAPAGSLLRGDIPSGLATERGIEYHLRVPSGLVVFRSPSGDVEREPGLLPVQLTDFVASGALATDSVVYRMEGFPVALNPATPGGQLEDDLGVQDIRTWRLGVWDPAASPPAYREYSSGGGLGALVPGTAYWLVTHAARSVDVTGRSVPRPASSRATLTLRPGWNQIADPFAFPVSLADVTVSVDGSEYPLAAAVTNGWVEAQPLHEYRDSVYVTSATRISPWTGYFVANLRASGDVLWNIPYRAAAATGPAQAGLAAAEVPWSLVLTATDESGQQAQVELGLADGAREGLDPLDRLASPGPPGGRLEFAALNERLAAAVSRMGRDVRPAAADSGVAWTLGLRSAARGVMRVSARLEGQPPEGLRAVLLDPEARRDVDLLAGGGYELLAREAGEQHTLAVAVGAASWVEARRLGANGPAFELALRPVAPNPASLPVFMQFTLPREEDVKLEIFDVAGRLVERLSLGARPAGLHTARWEGRADSGSPAAAGVYYARLQTKGQARTTRFVLLR